MPRWASGPYSEHWMSEQWYYYCQNIMDVYTDWKIVPRIASAYSLSHHLSSKSLYLTMLGTEPRSSSHNACALSLSYRSSLLQGSSLAGEGRRCCQSSSRHFPEYAISLQFTVQFPSLATHFPTDRFRAGRSRRVPISQNHGAIRIKTASVMHSRVLYAWWRWEHKQNK